MALAAALLTFSVFQTGHAVETSPMSKVFEMINDFQAKIEKEGEESKKMYEEFAEFCEDRSAELNHDIKEGKSQVAELKATIDEETALAGSLTEKISELSSSIATNKADLKAATEIREKEKKDFLAEEKELLDAIDTLARAVGILEREMQSGGASMMQINSAKTLSQALEVMVSASMFSAQDASRLTAFVQSRQEAEDGDANLNLGAPAASVYKSHSGGIVETITDMKDKAETQLDGARAKEMESTHNFEALKSSLQDEMKFASEELDQAKRDLSESEEKKSDAQGDLDVTSKTLSENLQALHQLHNDCMTKATEYEAEMHSRSEELKAIATAEKILKETTGGATDMVYGFRQVSLLQTARTRLTTSADLGNFEVVHYIRDLSRKQNSASLAQFAQRLASAVRATDESGGDQFAKIKGMIRDMITKLEAEAKEDATKEAHCDKEMKKSNDKKADKTSENEKLTTKIDEMTARSAKLTEEVASLQKSLSELAHTQEQMDKIRKEEKALYIKQSGDLEKALEGVKLALKVLNEYYAKSESTSKANTSGGIVSLLEIVESDFSKNLAEINETEESAASEYEAETKENAVQKAAETQDEKYKSREIVTLEKLTAEAKSDRSSVQDELDAINEYLAKLKKECTVMPDSYEVRKAKREAEIEGLKSALETLKSETALLQRSANRKARHGFMLRA